MSSCIDSGPFWSCGDYMIPPPLRGLSPVFWFFFGLIVFLGNLAGTELVGDFFSLRPDSTNHKDRALEYFKKAADAGRPDAQFRLGIKPRTLPTYPTFGVFS